MMASLRGPDGSHLVPTSLRRWYFTVLLGITYLVVFHAWQRLDYLGAVLTGLIATAALAALLLKASREHYFINRWDQAFHASVLLDILLEAVLIKHHEGYGFYWCALGFGIVICGYRALRIRTRNAPSALALPRDHLAS